MYDSDVDIWWMTLILILLLMMVIYAGGVIYKLIYDADGDIDIVDDV